MQRIQTLTVQTNRLDPAMAEVGVTATVEHLTATTELRGRLVGPQCRYASTIEIAYPFRAAPPPSAAEPLSARAIVPEPSLWEPQCPFLYRAIVELWESGSLQERHEVLHGLCVHHLSSHGLRWNGRTLRLRGVRCNSLTEDQAVMLRQQGINLLVAEADTSVLDLADRCGFLVLTSTAMEALLARHSSALGVLLPRSALLGNDRIPRARGRHEIGIELDVPLTEPLPAEIAFIVCAARLLPMFTSSKIPKLAVGSDVPTDDTSTILGTLEQ